LSAFASAEASVLTEISGDFDFSDEARLRIYFQCANFNRRIGCHRRQRFALLFVNRAVFAFNLSA
jgi:hypothetical protein